MISQLNRSIALDLGGLGSLLGGRRLSVPPFQRSYAWGPEQVDALWSDIRSAIVVEEPEYFLGTIVLAQEGDERSIIDGQQRLATASLLLAAIRNAFRSRDDEARASVIESQYLSARDLRSAAVVPRIRLNDADDAHFRSIVFEDDRSTDDQSPASHVRLTQAMNLLEAHVADEIARAGKNWAERLLAVVEALDSSVKLIIVSVASDADAYLIFETLNDRGLPLNIADLLKNFLFGISQSKSDAVQAAWAEMDATIQASADEETIKYFIRHSWMSSHGAVRERDLYRNIKRRIHSPSEALKTATDLARSSVTYTALLDPLNAYWIEREIEHDIPFTIVRLGLEQFRPMALAALETLDPSEIRPLLIRLTSWLTRGLVVGGIGGGTLERAYADAAVKIRDGEVTTVDQIFSQIESVVPTDEEFRGAFASRRVNRLRLTQYLVQACEQELMGLSDPSIVAMDSDASHSPLTLLPRKADAADWPAFSADSIGPWAHRLGNVVIVPGDLSRESPSGWSRKSSLLREVERPLAQAAAQLAEWTPREIEQAQEWLADAAVRTWPR